MSLRLQMRGTPAGVHQAVLGKVAVEPRELTSRGDRILVAQRLENNSDISGYAGVITAEVLSPERLAALSASSPPLLHGVVETDHLAEGDVVMLSPSGIARSLYRIASPHNSIFTTDRCNSYCLMCSQPPKQIDDQQRIYEHFRLIELIDPATRELGITGGEPTLLKDDLLRLVERCKDLLPATALHILSNGRLFYYGSFAHRLAEIGHPDLMVGIPLYSDIDSEHDHVVQCAGAFDETLIGLQNLARHGVPVEIRVVLHRHTVGRLRQLAEFIYRNLTFASHVAFMGLETIGFAAVNLDDLWVEPGETREQLEDATLFLAAHGMDVSLYNYQLCLLPRSLWPFCRRSISDWKNDYLPECEPCVERNRCGGFFTSAVQRRTSRHIRAIQREESGGRVGLGEEPIEAAREVRGRSRGAGGDRGAEEEQEQRQDERSPTTVPHG